MQKIEKWRMEELALILEQLADLLKRGDNCEWANVFFHFHHESREIISSKELDLNHVKNLLMNIKNCFSSMNSFKNLVLWHENEEEKMRLNQYSHKTKVHLLKIMTDIEDRSVEYLS